MHTDAVIRRNPQVVYRELAGRAAPSSSTSTRAPTTGSTRPGILIWSLIDGERTFDQLVADVREQLDDPPDDLAAETERFLADLRARDLIAG